MSLFGRRSPEPKRIEIPTPSEPEVSVECNSNGGLFSYCYLPHTIIGGKTYHSEAKITVGFISTLVEQRTKELLVEIKELKLRCRVLESDDAS